MMESLKGSSIKTPSAKAMVNAADTEVVIQNSSMKLEDGEWVLDEKSSILYAHQIERSASVVAASDREATIRSGMAIDLFGKAIAYNRPWIPVATQVDDRAFQRQMHELLGAINLVDENGRPEELRPELPCHWHGRTEWGTDTTLLLDRCRRHIDKVGETPPSAGLYGSDEPLKSRGWRCQTWEEVRSRCGSLDVLNADAREADAEADAEAQAETTPCTRPRTLELYCG